MILVAFGLILEGLGAHLGGLGGCIRAHLGALRLILGVWGEGHFWKKRYIEVKKRKTFRSRKFLKLFFSETTGSKNLKNEVFYIFEQ